MIWFFTLFGCVFLFFVLTLTSRHLGLKAFFAVLSILFLVMALNYSSAVANTYEKVFVPEFINKRSNDIIVWHEETGVVLSDKAMFYNMPTNEIRILKKIRMTKMKTIHSTVCNIVSANDLNERNQEQEESCRP